MPGIIPLTTDEAGTTLWQRFKCWILGHEWEYWTDKRIFRRSCPKCRLQQVRIEGWGRW